MANIFLSYTTNDYEVAKRLHTILNSNGLNVWFAPCNINIGNNYAQDIGTELGTLPTQEEDLLESIDRLIESKVLILLLSGSSMQSKWVAKEVKMAVNNDLEIIPLRIDNVPLNNQFQFMLSDVQIMEAQNLNRECINKLLERLEKIIPNDNSSRRISEIQNQRINYDEINVYPIANGDPYYKAEETIKLKLTNHRFFLAPSEEELAALDGEQLAWAKEHLKAKEEFFDMEWDEVFANIPIPDLKQRIEMSRRKILQQFVRHENGCYFNNIKFGINRINRFERTEDLSERPILTLELFTTDYYTHRVMKDVCKQLVAEKNEFIMKKLDFTHIEYTRIFFTSLGVNALLLEDELKSNRKLILTSRSVNAAETYSKHQYSVSVIEGVSYSDYDSFTGKVNLTAAVYRGLMEELGVEEYKLQMDTLRFYDFFVNRANLEMGISCSIELKKNLDLERDILNCHGKDEQLEIADKTLVEVKKLKPFLMVNRHTFLPQAMYTIMSYLEAIGDFVVERFNKRVNYKQSFIMNKDGSSNICGDAIVDTENFIAVIDGATPKGTRLWNHLRGDIFISQLISDTIQKMDRDIEPEAAITYINDAVKEVYKKNNIVFEELLPEERLQASLIIYSVKRHEIWSFGDCFLRINQRDYNNVKKLDVLMSSLRAFFVELEMVSGKHRYDPKQTDFGREKILPFLKQQNIFANTNYSFGYDVIDGGNIFPEHVVVYAVQTGDHIAMSTDGYPKLFDTLEDSEKYLAKCIKADPECIYELRGTKGISAGNISYDDRAYIGFSVE